MKFPFSTFRLPSLLLLCFLLTSCTALSGPARFAPPSGHGPLVLMFSGITGPMLYAEFARRLADSGYNALLLDGKDFVINDVPGCQNALRTIIAKYHEQAGISQGKTAVIGYSLGGAVALSCAAGMQEEIAGVIAYYPATRMISDQDGCVERFRVPVTVLQGEDDHYLNCCTVEQIRDMHAAALKKGKDAQLIVYPKAGHGFNLGPLKNKTMDEASWRKTMESLKQHFH